MRVLLLTDELLPGGVSRHVIDLANGLAEKKIHVSVAATEGIWRRELDQNINFLDIGLLKTNSFQKRIFGFPRAVLRLYNFMSENKVDIIHSHKRYTDMVGRILSRLCTIPHVSTCHNTFTTMHRLSVFGDVTIAPSQAIEQMLQKKFKLNEKRIRQIHLGRLPLRKYSKEEKQKIKAELGIEKKTIIASVGRIDADKDRATLLLAIKRLEEQKLLEHVVFVVVGDGDLKPAVMHLADKLQIHHRIKILGSGYDIEGLFNIADFCVLSSIRDGGTLYVNLEAASLSKPHIATNVGGIPEFIVHEKTGLLVEPQSPVKLAEQIKRLLDDPVFAKELGKGANQLFCQRHTYDRFISETVAVYEQLLT